jgi:peptidyl-prolyl cis-trans isomerase SurA
VKASVLSVIALAFLGQAFARSVDRIAAVVNDEVITLSQVYELGRDHIETASRGGTGETRRAAEITVLDAEIRRVLIDQELNRLGLVVTEQELNRNLEAIGSEHGMDRAALEAAVAADGLGWLDYLAQVRQNLRHRKFQEYLIRPRIVESEDMLRQAYNRMVRSADRPVEVELGAILVMVANDSLAENARVRLLMEAIRARHAAGESFAKLAAEFDMGGYGQDGGAMGRFKKGELLGDLEVFAFSSEPGALSQPIKSGPGYFLLELRVRELQPVLPFEEVRDDLSLKVFQAQFVTEEDAWYQMARREASVEVKLEEPDKL